VALISACQRGERDALRRLFDLYRDRMLRFAFRYCGDLDDAEDLTQEIFLRAFERIGSYRCESAFSSWLYRLAANLCLNFRRQSRRFEPLDAIEDRISGASDDPADAAISSEQEDAMMKAVSDLPDGLRIAFLLVRLEGFSYAEAAESLGVSPEAVRMRMMRARRALRVRLTREGAMR
jgi:RNA polymerase sigma-70 factor (ECF subfamily)